MTGPCTMCNMLEGNIKEKSSNTDPKHTARLCPEVELTAGCGNMHAIIWAFNNLYDRFLAVPGSYFHVPEPIFPSSGRTRKVSK